MAVLTEELDNHPLIKVRPNFRKAYFDFISFLEVTKGDLMVKKEALENERKNLKSGKGLTNRRMKNYLSCQLFMLRKHTSRLEGFEREIESRLVKVLKSESSGTSSPQSESPQLVSDAIDNIETEISLARINLNESPDVVPEIVVLQDDGVDFELNGGNNDVITDSNEAEEVAETTSCHSAGNLSSQMSETGSSSYSVSLGNEESFDSSASSSINMSPPKLEDDESEQQLDPKDAAKDQQLMQLLADMNKMKRRCKHILDVTDQYCVIRPIDLTCEPDAPLPPELNSRSATNSPDLRQSSNTLPDPISQHLMRSTLESLGNHLAVIAKTYTRRHSNEITTSP